MLLLLLTLCVVANASTVMAEQSNQNTSEMSTNSFVDLAYLAGHLAEFENLTISTNGTVRTDGGSIYMFEDFWLQAQNGAKIMIVTRYAKLTVPSNGSLIKVSGVIQHSNLEGGFYFLNATSWIAITLPEFPSIMLPLLALVVSSSFLLYFCSSKKHLRFESLKKA